MAATSLFKIEKEPISEETQHLAVIELRETEDIVAQGYKELRELLAGDSSLFYHTDDDFLSIFLRPCKYYPKSAYNLVSMKFKYLIYLTDNNCMYKGSPKYEYCIYLVIKKFSPVLSKIKFLYCYIPISKPSIRLDLVCTKSKDF